MKSFFYRIVKSFIGVVMFFPIFVIALIYKDKGDMLIWGPVPILNNKYWSNAMKNIGYKSITYMTSYYAINQENDFDKYYFCKGFWGKLLYVLQISNYYAFIYCLKNAKIVHIPYSGGPLGDTILKCFEAWLLHLSGCKIIVLPYGGDSYCYSRVLDKNLTAGLLASYPEAAKKEKEISWRVSYWNKNADCVLCGFELDGMGRWDVNVPQYVVVNTMEIHAKRSYSLSDGKRGIVRIIHTPNHRGFKGTEFLIEAVKELQEEGLSVELVLLEKKSNQEVLRLLSESDILAEQFIFTGYALSGLEGMATGLPVMSNLDNECYTRIYRRYSYLNECPILSTTPETLKDNLRILITHPELRKELGMAGRKYVEKYHSYKAAQYLFSNIYDKILYGKDVDLMNLFHPLKSDYVKNNPVEHPLVENKLPKDYFSNEH